MDNLKYDLLAKSVFGNGSSPRPFCLNSEFHLRREIDERFFMMAQYGKRGTKWFLDV